LRVLSIDIGKKRIGLAMSDELRIIASPFEVLEIKDLGQALSRITKLVGDNNVSTVVMGLPINMDGSEGESAISAREFMSKLQEKADFESVFIDERLSSVEAHNILDEAGVHWSKRKNIIDSLAAQIILQAYLDKK